ncbi:MAG: hypothetical protein B7Z76_14225 [Acidiphilium sp. 20-67-58]|uniref:hypothetical protein n=1 Tax=Acidiphilium sp. 20-67-58 TaxID=1970291 RepID=UPI000BD1ACA6|nr:hypothetical protein [Acidiphilium sp. 20-67-58]OYV54528.1 MAG: hypothetical protein B7Z76_14225 [Acidiphilium sp. 20-67-58]
MTAPIKKIQAILESIDLPRREIKCYGSQIMITCAGRQSAEKWAALVAKFARVRNVFETVDEVRTNGGAINYVPVWRVAGVIA